MTVHSRIGASSMSRWMKCAGSVRLSEGMPNMSSKDADEGTKAHEIAEWFLTRQTRHGFQDVFKDLSNDDAEAISLYVNFILDRAEGAELFIEQQFDLSEIFPGLFGTADAVIYDPISKVLQVWDLKFGKGILVEAAGNVQTRYYGLGAALKLNRPVGTIILGIVQPRAQHPDGPIRSESIDAIELANFASDLRDYAERTQDPNASLVPGEHCRFCPAKSVCTAFSDKANAIAQVEFKPEVVGGTYDPVVLAKTLTDLPILKAYVKSVEEFAYAEAMHGRVPPGFKLVEKRATRKWTSVAHVEPKLKDLFADLNDAYEHELKSPPQIEKILGKKLFQQELAACVASVSSGLALVGEDDDRPGIKNAAQADFNVEGLA